MNLYMLFSNRKRGPDRIGLADERAGDQDQRKRESSDILRPAVHQPERTARGAAPLS